MNRKAIKTFTSILFILITPFILHCDEPLKIMPLGNSITQGDYRHNSYRRSLWHKLINSGYNADFIGSQSNNFMGPPLNMDFDPDHEGHWGWRADEVQRKIDKWASIHRPDVVLIHLGHNDLFSGNSIKSTIRELGHIIDILRSHNPEIIILLAQIIPTHPGYNAILTFNQLIPGLAGSKNTKKSPVIVVNQAKGFNPRIDTYDGVHPNSSGEEKMASRWYETIVKITAGKGLK